MRKFIKSQSGKRKVESYFKNPFPTFYLELIFQRLTKLTNK